MPFGNAVGPYVAAFGRSAFVCSRLRYPSGIDFEISARKTAQLEGEGHYAQLVLTLGIALILENGVKLYSAPSSTSVQRHFPLARIISL